MTNIQVANLFSQGAQKATGSNLFIENGVIYSYGYHFPIAVHHNGITYVNIDKYSPTTSKHQTYVKRALRNMPTALTTTDKLREIADLPVVYGGSRQNI